MLVLDPAGSWLDRWRTSFAQFGIATLRSPLHFHPAPDDADALRAFVERQQRHGETSEVRYEERARKSRRQLTARERQINERDRRDYCTVSTSLFDDFCDELIDRYDLADLPRQAKVTDISYTTLHVNDGQGHVEGFCIETESGERYGARAVIVATGGSTLPMIPKAISSEAVSEGPGWTHSSRFMSGTLDFPPPGSKHIIVVGGGLTSAQITDLAIRRGVFKVTLLCRSRLKGAPR